MGIKSYHRPEFLMKFYLKTDRIWDTHLVFLILILKSFPFLFGRRHILKGFTTYVERKMIKFLYILLLR